MHYSDSAAKCHRRNVQITSISVNTVMFGLCLLTLVCHMEIVEQISQSVPKISKHNSCQPMVFPFYVRVI